MDVVHDILSHDPHVHIKSLSQRHAAGAVYTGREQSLAGTVTQSNRVDGVAVRAETASRTQPADGEAQDDGPAGTPSTPSTFGDAQPFAFDLDNDEVADRIEGLLATMFDALDATRLPGLTPTNAMSASNPRATSKFARTMIVLDVIHDLILMGRLQTQRDLFYTVKSQDMISTPAQANTAIQDVCKALAVPRSIVNVTTAGGKGRVSGCLRILVPEAGHWTDCEASVFAVPGNINTILEMAFQTTARHVLVIEKEATFQALRDCGFCRLFPCILFTASGMPDIASKAFLSHLVTKVAPRLTALVVVDWNPSGACILLNYKRGGKNPESLRFAVDVKWLGIRHHMLQTDCDEADFQKLSDLDAIKLANLMNNTHVPAAWQEELAFMQAKGAKAEIEAAYKLRGLGPFCQLIVECISRHNFL